MQILFEIISNHNSNTSNAGDTGFAGWMESAPIFDLRRILWNNIN